MKNIASQQMLIAISLFKDLQSVSSSSAAVSLADGSQSFELANLLRSSAPGRAYDFALDMHERACKGCDDHWRDLWRSVVETLRAGHRCVEEGKASQPSSQPVDGDRVRSGLCGSNDRRS